MKLINIVMFETDLHCSSWIGKYRLYNMAFSDFHEFHIWFIFLLLTLLLYIY